MKRKNPFSQGCKKGNLVIDLIIIIVVLFASGIAWVYGSQIFDDLNNDIMDDDDISDYSKNISNPAYTNYPSMMDGIVLFSLILLIIFVVISVFMIDTHPIFFIITLIILIAVFIVAMWLSNAYIDIMSGDDISAYANNFPYTHWVLSHLVELMVGTALLTSLALYIKFKG